MSNKYLTAHYMALPASYLYIIGLCTLWRTPCLHPASNGGSVHIWLLCVKSASVTIDSYVVVNWGYWDYNFISTRKHLSNSCFNWSKQYFNIWNNVRIHQEYAKGAATLPQRALYLFQLPEKKRLRTPLEDRRRWLDLVKAERASALGAARALRTRHFYAE